jgi:hypothetical protein
MVQYTHTASLFTIKYERVTILTDETASGRLTAGPALGRARRRPVIVTVKVPSVLEELTTSRRRLLVRAGGSGVIGPAPAGFALARRPTTTQGVALLARLPATGDAKACRARGGNAGCVSV